MSSKARELFIGEIISKIEEYRQRYKLYKFLFLFTKAMSIVVVGAVIPGLAIIFAGKNLTKIIAWVSFFIGVLAAIDTLFKFKSQWKNYELFHISLSSEYRKYKFKSDGYEGLDDEQSLSRFVKIVTDLEEISRKDKMEILDKAEQLPDLDVQRE
ncbi:DUF4231 domain-containing protein [Flavivirga amylovorans]|uniref:DUF4231 domain-containing protein n=1 Tax=Flavivirga amylovorans TaxID=870486 RepID=A0ABT8X263_9FLAO|nr:DUF4231 domain-containing protein [Flavivirga amylovorans]MDO5987802.1 DUF4231 domain-containing protein [Flavivirga amylovorans]